MTEPTSAAGAEIERLRLQRGLSVRGAAKQAGISDGWWRQIELGYQQATPEVRVPVKPSARSLAKIVRVLDLDATETARVYQLAGLPLPEAPRPVLAGPDHEPVEPPTEFAFPQAAQLHRPELIEAHKTLLLGLLDTQERLDAAEEQARRAQS